MHGRQGGSDELVNPPYEWSILSSPRTPNQILANLFGEGGGVGSIN